MRNSFVNTLYSLSEINKDIVLITGDLGFGVLNKFRDTYPKQFINAGISEQNITSVAAGMAIEGKVVFTYSIANFPTLRCLEQIRNDVAYHNANVKIVAVGGGFSYGPMGMSHHATEDIAIMRAIPNMIVFTPCDPIETSAITKIVTEIDQPCYIRLGKGGEIDLNDGLKDVKIGKANILKHGNDTAIFASGAITYEALTAARELDKYGIRCAVYSFPTVKPLDNETVLKVANEVNRIFTLEEHNIVGGFGSAVAEVLAEHRAKATLTRLGLRDVFTSLVGSQEYLRHEYGIDATCVLNIIKSSF